MVNYEELKTLPDEEKIKVLKELAEKYTRDGKPYFPAIATALGGSVIAVANLYNRLVEGKSVGRPRKEDKVDEPEIKEKKKRGPKPASEKVETSPTPIQVPVLKEEPQENQQNNNYNFSMNAVFDGEEAAERVIAIANSFFKKSKYSIEMKVKEL